MSSVSIQILAKRNTGSKGALYQLVTKELLASLKTSSNKSFLEVILSNWQPWNFQADTGVHNANESAYYPLRIHNTSLNKTNSSTCAASIRSFEFSLLYAS